VRSLLARSGVARSRIEVIDNPIARLQGDRLFHGVHVNEDFFKWFNQEDRIKFLIEWIEIVAKSMEKKIGYDGIQSLLALNISRNYQFSKKESYEKVNQYIDSQFKLNRR
jgi:hypothetical protein